MTGMLRSPLFIIILAIYLIAGGLYAFLTPTWQAPDEPAHCNYVRYLTTRSGFPELSPSCYNQTYLTELTTLRFPPDLSIDNICYEFHQPPLYYLMGMPMFVLTTGSLPLLRFFSMALLGSGGVVLAFLIAWTIFPNRPAIAYGTMAFVAFVPMHLAILSSINNDALAELILAAILYILIQRLIFDRPPPQNGRPPPYFQHNLLLGILLGLGLGAKMTVYIAIPLVAAVLWWTSTKETEKGKAVRDWRGLAKQAALIFGLALLIILPWFIRNTIIYGNFDIWGLGRHDEIVEGQLRTADHLAEAGLWTYLSDFVTTTFHSFWGQFGWMAVPMDRRVYLILTLLTLMAVSGLIAFWRSARSTQITAPEYDLSTTGQRRALGLMGIVVILMVLGYGWYNLAFVQFQGRYLFPALIPLAIFFALGLNETLSPRRMWWLAGGLAIALGWVVITSLLKGDLDKWGALITGLTFGAATGRALLARYWSIPPSWLMTGCYAALGLLALLSPFWFIVPHLSP